MTAHFRLMCPALSLYIERWGYMEDKHKINVSVDVDSRLLSHAQAFASREGIPLQCLVGEALNEFISSRRSGEPRAHVMAAFEGSHRQYQWLYQLLSE